MRNYLKYQTPGIQFAVFMGLAAAMFFLYFSLSGVFFGSLVTALSSAKNEISYEVLQQFRWSQVLSAVLTFIIPAIVYAYLSDPQPLTYLGLQRNIKGFVVFIVILLLVIAQPFAIYMGQINQQIDFGPIQQGLLRQEKVFENAMSNFVRMKSPADLLINIIIVGILPAVGEELFFRGALQSILERWIRIPWVAILLSSFAFAILHGTAFKFLGIFTLGLVLGTLFYLTRNLWYNVLFHFLNNSLALLATYYATQNNMLKKLADDEFKVSALAALTSLVLTIGLFLIIRKRSPEQPMTSSSTGNTHFDIE